MPKLDRTDRWGLACFACLFVPLMFLVYRGWGVGEFRHKSADGSAKIVRMLINAGYTDPQDPPLPAHR